MPKHILTAMAMDRKKRKKVARILKTIPEFPSWEQEEEFWETHSTADYAFEDVPAEDRLLLRWDDPVSAKKQKAKVGKK